MRTIAIVNQKGGCGKTTTAINLASIYARRGDRTLLVDMDPQAHCAAGLGVPEAAVDRSIVEALLADDVESAVDGIVWEVSENLGMIPSSMRLAGLEAPGGGLHRLHDKDRRLARVLDVLAPKYDRCLIDCPPTIGLLTYNALRAARETIIPVEMSFFALQGARKQWTTIRKLIERIDRPIACHLLATLHRPGSKLSNRILATLRREFAGQIIPDPVREHEALREAACLGQPIIEFAPDSEAMKDFDQLADWLDAHASRPQVDLDLIPGDRVVTAAYYDSSGRLNPAVVQAADPQAPGGRAAELARRVHELNRVQHSPPRAEVTAAEPAIVTPRSVAAGAIAPHPIVPTEVARERPVERLTPPPLSPPPLPTSVPPPGARLQHMTPPPLPTAASSGVHGVHVGDGSVRFTQPGLPTQTMFIAADFNHWSATATPMRYDAGRRVFETTVELGPGRYQYRLIVDKHWQQDTHNPRQQLNAYGEPNSLIIVG